MSVQPSFEDRQDYRDAERGFLGALNPGVIRDERGHIVWDIDQFDFLEQECPPTANPKLWRQGQLNSKQGLYEIVPGIYQIRAFDLSNMTIVEGKEGVIIIDPLVSCECAKAGLDIYQKYRGSMQRITGMIYSHSHGDHYMGAGGLVAASTNPSFPILAPEGFMEAVVSESILAGPAMRKRGAFMYGTSLPKGPAGHIGVGLGMASSNGTTSLIPPNILVLKTGEEHVIDGVRIVFQMVPGTEAPAEMNYYLPDFKALCVTLRGAQVRDAKAWSFYLDEAIELFGRNSEVLFGSHNWPTWGRQELIRRLAEQRDLYGYLHDQTVRMMNMGLTGTEIAERIKLPPKLALAWRCQGFYGSVSHNVKGIYQKYMTWFDGNPTHLWPHPPAAEGERYVECMGGLDSLCDKADDFIRKGDLRFAATLLGHAVAAFPTHERSASALASTYEKLGYGAECAPWRNFYLVGAQELRTGKKAGTIVGGRTRLGAQLSIDQWFDILAVQLDGEEAAEDSFVVEFDVTDEGAIWTLRLSNAVLSHRCRSKDTQEMPGTDKVDLKVTLSRRDLLEILRGKDCKNVEWVGNREVFRRLLDLTSVSSDSVTT